MENVMTNGFTELSENEMYGVDGGGTVFGDIFEKVDVLGVGKVIYKAGMDFGSTSVICGRELYGFYRDVKTIIFK